MAYLLISSLVNEGARTDRHLTASDEPVFRKVQVVKCNAQNSYIIVKYTQRQTTAAEELRIFIGQVIELSKHFHFKYSSLRWKLVTSSAHATTSSGHLLLYHFIPRYF